jgi:hypothetical protein
MNRLLLSSLATGIYSIAFSQTFTPEMGLNYMFQPTSWKDQRSCGIIYSPRLNFYECKNSSFSIGFPLTFGWSDFRNVQITTVDIPLEIDYNFGAGSVKGSRRRLGYFAGVGYGFHLNNVPFDPAYSPYNYFSLYSSFRGVVGSTGLALSGWEAISSFGPTLNAGFRIATGHRGKTIEFRLSYMNVLEVPDFLHSASRYAKEFVFLNTHIFGFGCLFSF